MSEQSWMNHPSLGQIDPQKLSSLALLAEQAKGKNQRELLQALLSAQGMGLQFPPNEIDSIIEALKHGKSPQEVERIDRLYTLIRQFRNSN